ARAPPAPQESSEPSRRALLPRWSGRRIDVAQDQLALDLAVGAVAYAEQLDLAAGQAGAVAARNRQIVLERLQLEAVVERLRTLKAHAHRPPDDFGAQTQRALAVVAQAQILRTPRDRCVFAERDVIDWRRMPMALDRREPREQSGREQRRRHL